MCGEIKTSQNRTIERIKSKFRIHSQSQISRNFRAFSTRWIILRSGWSPLWIGRGDEVSKYDSEARIPNNKITEGRSGWNEASKRYNDLLLEELRMHSTPWNSGSIGNTISTIKPVPRCILHRFYLRKKRFNRQG